MSVYIYERHIKMTNDYIIFSIENPNLKVSMKHQHFSVDLLSLDFIPETVFPIVLNLVFIGFNHWTITWCIYKSKYRWCSSHILRYCFMFTCWYSSSCFTHVNVYITRTKKCHTTIKVSGYSQPSQRLYSKNKNAFTSNRFRNHRT
jgi:hypothetical protein